MGNKIYNITLVSTVSILIIIGIMNVLSMNNDKEEIVKIVDKQMTSGRYLKYILITKDNSYELMLSHWVGETRSKKEFHAIKLNQCYKIRINGGFSTPEYIDKIEPSNECD